MNILYTLWRVSNGDIKLIVSCWDSYSVLHRFRPAKFAYGGLILSSSQFFPLPQPLLKPMLAIKVVEIGSRIIIPLLSLYVGQTEQQQKILIVNKHYCIDNILTEKNSDVKLKLSQIFSWEEIYYHCKMSFYSRPILIFCNECERQCYRVAC